MNLFKIFLSNNIKKQFPRVWGQQKIKLALMFLLLLGALGGCQKSNSGGTTGGNPAQSTLPSQISIDAQ